MYNDYMYAIDRSDEYLEHYGIKGMKWGVRKAIERGGTGLGNRRLARQYRKAQKKLAKLEKRANNGAKYARRAAALGAGAAAAGGLAVQGTRGAAIGVANASDVAAKASKGIGRALTLVPGRNKVSQALHRTGANMYNAGNVGDKFAGQNAIRKGGATLSKTINDWGNSSSITNKIIENNGKAIMKLHGTNNVAANAAKSGLGKTNKMLAGVSNNTIARAGAAALGAGLAGAAGYNAYRAATTKRAAQKAADFRKEMNKTFAGTAYGKQGGSKKRRRR